MTSESRSAPQTIIIVDDEVSLVRTITEELEPLGYNIMSANNGNHGLACIEFYKPDLVILDMMMPRRSGLLVLEGMREMDQYIPAIMITGNEGTRHRHYAEILGVDAYLNKPLRMEVLVRTVRQILSERAGSKTARQ
jgi:DNA-binding response OmpR family regulator